MTDLEFSIEITYDLPFNIKVNTDVRKVDFPDNEFNVDQELHVRIKKMNLKSDEQQNKLIANFEVEVKTIKGSDEISKEINNIKSEILDLFREIAENFGFLLGFELNMPLIFKNIQIYSKVIKGDKQDLHIFLDIKPSINIMATSIINKQPELNNLRNAVKNSIYLTRLDQKFKERIDLLKRIIKWYYYSINESNSVDKFIYYLMIFEIWKLYKAIRDNDDKCIPKQDKSGNNKKPIKGHKNCLHKALEATCYDMFSKLEKGFDEFYNKRNEVIHEGPMKVESEYLDIASNCVQKIIGTVQNEIRIITEKA